MTHGDYTINAAGRMPEAWYGLSPNHSGPLIGPKFLVMHYTAGWSAEGARDYLMRSDARASGHLVVGRDGQVWQIVPFNLKAWHAGRSFYRGIAGLNHHSIGIEIDNIGWLRPDGRGGYRDPYHRRIECWDGVIHRPVWRVGDQEVGDDPYCNVDEILVARHDNGGPELAWPDYTEAQLDAVEAATRAILAAYPTIREIVGHDQIAPDRKTDPGPAFPMHRFRALVSDRRAENGDPAVVTASALNVREGAGTGYDRHEWGPLPRGTVVERLADKGAWVLIETSSGDRGYVHGAYIASA